MAHERSASSLDKDAWLQQQENERHERIVAVRQPLGLSPPLYFSTRRCTYSDVVSVVTTSKRIPRLSSSIHTSSDSSPLKRQINGATRTSLNDSFERGGQQRSAVAWAEHALSTSKEAQQRASERSFVGISSLTTAYTAAPLERDRDRVQRLHAQQSLALSTEKQVFMTRLQDKRRARFTREHAAALVIQRVYRGHVLRKRFHILKMKLQLRKRIRRSLAKVTRGTAIVMSENDRRTRVRAAQTAAATSLQRVFRVWSARRVAMKERVLRQFEQRARYATTIQREWRASIARQCASRTAAVRHEQRQQALAAVVARLFRGYSARQRVRRIRLRQRVLAAQRLQWTAQRHLASKARTLQRRRRRTEQQHRAAQQVQRVVRGCLARACVLRLRVCEELTVRAACALAIQRVVRGFLGRQRMRYQRVFDIHERAWRCALHVTRIVRGFLARRVVQLERVLQETDLLVQARRGNLPAIIDLLDGFGTIDDAPADLLVVSAPAQNTVLHLAVRHGHFAIVTHVVPLLLASSAPRSVYARNRNGETPLELAINHSHDQIAAYLLATTSSIFDAPSATIKRSLILTAARSGMGAVVTKLLLLFPQTFTGAERDPRTQRTILHEALLLLRPVRFEAPHAKSERDDRVVATLTTVLTKVPRVQIDAQDFVGFTALHLAASLGCLRAVRLLLEYDADVTIVDVQQRTAWRIALLLNHESCFLEIRRKWLDSVAASSSTSGSATVLDRQDSAHEKTQNDSSDDASRALVSAAAATNARTPVLHPQLEQALVAACCTDDVATVRFLVEDCDVSINAIDRSSGSDSDSVLMIACRADNERLVRYLLKQEHLRDEPLDVHYVNSSSKKSALEYALSSSNVVILRLLVTKCTRFDMNHRIGTKRHTVYHEAMRRRGEAIRDWLYCRRSCDAGVLTSSMLAEAANGDADGDSLLISTVAFGHNALAKTLINVGVCVSQQSTSSRRTALHEACRVGNSVLVQRMLCQQPHERDALDARDADGRSPFFDAVTSGSIDCVERLLHATTNSRGRCTAIPAARTTVIHEAVLSSHVDVNGHGLLHVAAAAPSSPARSSDSGDSSAMLTYLIRKLPHHLDDQFSPQRRTPLHCASAAGNAAAIALLLHAHRPLASSNNSDASESLPPPAYWQLCDCDGELPHHIAARNSDIAVLDAFTAAGIDCDALDAQANNEH